MDAQRCGAVSRYELRCAIRAAQAERSYGTRSFAVDESGVASRGRPGAQAHTTASGPAASRPWSSPRPKPCAQQVIERFRVPSSCVSSRAASELRMSFAPWQSPDCSAILSLRGDARAAKESPRVNRSVAEVRRRHRVDLVLAGRKRVDFNELRPEPGLRVDGRSQRYRSGAALLRRAGLGLPLALRRLRPAGARGHAVRRLCAHFKRRGAL